MRLCKDYPEGTLPKQNFQLSLFPILAMDVMYRLIYCVCVATVLADYWTDRAHLIEEDSSKMIGSAIILTPEEELVNKKLMEMKLEEFQRGFKHPDKFLAALHFFESRSKIDKSALFDFIKKIPKGASLHSHDLALVSLDYLYNITFRDNLYGCILDGRLILHFFGSNVNTDCEWDLVADLRAKNSSFDAFLKTQLSLLVDDPYQAYPSLNIVWSKFQQTFGTVIGMLTYRPVFQEYFYQALQELYEDNVMYFELRGTLPEVYELNGTVYGPESVLKFYVDITESFRAKYPDFLGVKFIYAPWRNANNATCDNYVKTVVGLKTKYPDFLAGFDLVGQEDTGNPLVDFIPQFLELADVYKIKFFFHAAETNWFGLTDMNLVDAVLLNTTRIGHGYGILKHPALLAEVKKRHIALEVSPISNQVLKLVDDLRNHPAAFLVSEGYPVVITCDDPTFWNARALSYDWYVAFMAFGSKDSDLRLLKQLALNSILYSALNEEEKCDAVTKWEKQWDNFVHSVLDNTDYRNCISVNILR